MDHFPDNAYFSDYIVSFLSKHGFEKVVFNPGASFRGIHDSLVFEANETFAPEIVMACHEEIAVAIAHGYYKASGRHMAVLIHANVGLLHASMAIFNAWCDRVPLFMIAGNGPIDAAKRLAEGARDDIDAIAGTREGRSALALIAEMAGGVAFVDQHGGLVVLGEIADFGQFGDIAIHGENAVGDDELEAGSVVFGGL